MDEYTLEISPGIFCVDLFLFIKEHSALIISDLHIGFEESLNSQGIMLPKTNYAALKSRILSAIGQIEKQNIKKIIINGDLLHTFGKRNSSERDNARIILKLLSNYGEVIIIRGNHDKGISFITESVEEIILGDLLITHGDVVNKHTDDKAIKTIIIGHEHPAIVLSHGARTEKFKCFLKGEYLGKKLIVTPSANLMVEGTDILKERLLSPYLKKNINNCEIFIVEDRIYEFGKVQNFS